jgi:long-chain fatty acid transport protein
MIRRFYYQALLAILIVILHAPAVWAGGVWLYEGGTPDLGAAGAGRAALAADASTTSVNPTGMTRRDRSQLLAAVQGLYINTQFNTDLSGFGGVDGGNAGGFVPNGGLHYVHRVTDGFRLGISATPTSVWASITTMTGPAATM